jgi:hypothetical protein
MRVRFGAILCLILGAVLIQSGLSSGDSSTIGVLVNPCLGGVGVDFACPLGVLTLDEVTDANGNTSASPPPAWTVHLGVSTDCTPPSNPDRTVNNNGTLTYSGLDIYNRNQSVKCQYTITEHAVAPYTASFDPAPPYTFLDEFPIPNPPGFRANAKTTAQTVTLTNTATAPPASSTPATSTPATSTPATPTATPTATRTRTRTKTQTHTASATVASEPPVSPSSPVASSSAGPVLASTGPHHQVRASLIAGVALVLLGGILLVAGRRPRRARHV